MSDRITIEDAHISSTHRKRFDAYHEANGDPDALLLRIVDQHSADTPWPSLDIAIDRADARALFNWLGAWLHKQP